MIYRVAWCTISVSQPTLLHFHLFEKWNHCQLIWVIISSHVTAKPVLSASLCSEEKREREKVLQPSTEQPMSEGKLRGTDGGLRALICPSLPLRSQQSLWKRGDLDKRQLLAPGWAGGRKNTALQVRAGWSIRGWDWQCFPLEELALGAVKSLGKGPGKRVDEE